MQPCGGRRGNSAASAVTGASAKLALIYCRIEVRRDSSRSTNSQPYRYWSCSAAVQRTMSKVTKNPDAAPRFRQAWNWYCGGRMLLERNPTPCSEISVNTIGTYRWWMPKASCRYKSQIWRWIPVGILWLLRFSSMVLTSFAEFGN